MSSVLGQIESRHAKNLEFVDQYSPNEILNKQWGNMHVVNPNWLAASGTTTFSANSLVSDSNT